MSVETRLKWNSFSELMALLPSSIMLLLSLLFVPETFAPTLLRRKAARLQKKADAENTGEVFIAKYDKIKKTTWEIIKVGMGRPFEMMFKEVIVACLGVYGECRSILKSFLC